MLFREFEEKEQWIIFLLSVVVGILTTIGSFSKLGLLLSIAMGLTISGVGYAAALMHRKLSVLAENIDLQIRKADKDRRQIAAYLEDIIVLAKQDKMKKKVRKTLNGVLQILTLKGIEEMTLRARVLKALMSKAWKKAISVSAYSSPNEWMDPYWFSYLSLQIGRAAELKQKNITAKRYFVYKKKVVEDYIDELALLVQAHNNYIQPFLYFSEDIEKDLEKKGFTLVDFNLIEYEANDEIILWRNPDKNGEVEEATDQKAQLIKEMICFLEEKEDTLDRKGILQHGQT